MRRPLAALAVSVLAVAGTALAGTPSRTDPPAPQTAARAMVAPTSGARITAVAGLEREALLAINALRRERGLFPLRLNGKLAASARRQSRSMAEYGFFRHASHDGSAFWRRVKPLYPPRTGRYWGVGENMVWTSPGLSAEKAIEMWLKSPPHRKNLLTPAWRDIGLGGVHALAAPGVYQGLDVTILTADFGIR